jgi:superfamily II DNA/RNA helicase
MEPETYVHRIGRTGRAGAFGIAMSFVDREQRSLLGAIERLLRKKIPVQAIEITDEKPAFAVAGSPPSPVATTESAAAPRTQDERPRGEFRERSEGRPYREKREGGYQGRKDRTGAGTGESRSYGNREGRSYGNRSQGDRPAHARKFGDRPKYGERQQSGDRPQGGERPRYGERRDNGDRPQYGKRPTGKRFGDRPAFVPRERGEVKNGDQPQTGDAAAAPQTERRFERRPAGERPQGRFQQESRGSYGNRPRRDGEGRPAYGEQRPGRKFPPKRFEGQRQAVGKDQRPRRDDAAAVLPPAGPRREAREGANAAETTGFRPKRKTPIMKKKRHQGGSNSGPANGTAAPRRYDNGGGN